MKSRKENVEEIMQSLHGIRRKFVAHKFVKNKKSPITSSQWMALGVVMRHEDLSITGLAEILHVTSSATTQLVDELVDKGYLVREDKTGDRRMLSLALSPMCRKKIGEIKKRNIKRFAGIFDALSDKELERFAFLSKKIGKNVLKN